MTSIAFDGKTMAADKQMNTGNMKHTVARSKIRAGEYHGMPALFGGSGTTVYCDAVIEWLIAGMPDDKPEMPSNPDSFTVIVATEAGLYEYIDSLRPIPLGQIKWAIGSGGEYAFGAMAAGACAKKAVEIACTFDPNSGMGVETLTLRKR
jgi:ATP-dependent protease HslVU (ClpYQ) peptidase subunit